jgi:hypothetical protein
MRFALRRKSQGGLRPSVSLVAASAVCLLAVAAGAKERAAPSWFTGKAFDQQLELSTDLACANRPLGAVLGNLAQSQRLAIWLDRRVDPDRLLALSVSAEPLKSVLAQIAARERLGCSTLGPVVYFGPADAATKLRTLAYLRREELKPLPAARRKAFEAMRTWQWSDLATPRDLLSGLAREAHVELSGLEQIPHDLWPARSLPLLSWIDRLTLITIQFDLTFQIAADGKSVALVALPEKVAASRTYPAGADGRETVQVWARQFPQADVRLAGDHIVVRGHVEDLEAIVAGATARGTKTKTTSPGKQVYKLTTEKPLAVLLDELGKRLDLDFQLDRAAIAAAGIATDQIVSVKVEDVSLDELINAVLGPAKLAGQRRGRTVSVAPAK